MARLRAICAALSGTRALAALVVALAVTTAGAVVLAGRDVPTSDPADMAFLDAEATADLVATTTSLVDQVFSVDPRRAKAQARLIGEHLSAAAQQQFRELYAPYLAKDAARITLQTAVSSVGVIRLQEGKAEVLVIADQRASAPDGRSNAGTAQIRLSLAGGTGAWQITAIDPV